MQLDLITNRNQVATFVYGVVYEIEDLLVNYCGANLIHPIPRERYKQSILKPSKVSNYTIKLLQKTIKCYQPITVNSSSQDEPKVLGIICLNGGDLMLLDAIKDWRQQYDIVFAYVLDCWMYEAYPQFTCQLDQVFIPFPELQRSLQEHIRCPVSVLPYGSNVLAYGMEIGSRSIDVISYGRTADDYHHGLINDFNTVHPELCYYQFGVGADPKTERYPRTEWGPTRFDYQNRLALAKILRRSKIALAFENLYTSRVGERAREHIIFRAQHSFMAYRWFECSGAGCAIVGKRPQSELYQQYMGWEDATIELPDDVNEGIAMIHALLEDHDRLVAIYQRNYLESLARNDWRHRFKAMFEGLELPIPTALRDGLQVLNDTYAHHAQNQILVGNTSNLAQREIAA